MEAVESKDADLFDAVLSEIKTKELNDPEKVRAFLPLCCSVSLCQVLRSTVNLGSYCRRCPTSRKETALPHRPIDLACINLRSGS